MRTVLIDGCRVGRKDNWNRKGKKRCKTKHERYLRQMSFKQIEDEKLDGDDSIFQFSKIALCDGQK